MSARIRFQKEAKGDLEIAYNYIASVEQAQKRALCIHLSPVKGQATFMRS